MIAKQLCGERLAAVCSPAMQTKITQVSDLFDQPLLYNVAVMSEWREWFEAQQLIYREPAASFEFQNTSQILDACLSGAGVALIDPLMIKQHLSQGDLVNIFDSSVESLRSYFIVYPERYQQQDNIQVFEQWIINKMADDPLMLDRLPV